MKKYLIEVIGTFFLVLTIGLTAVYPPGAGMMAPLAIGLVLSIMVYAGGPISGGHYNPAVTIGVWLRGGCSPSSVLPYIIAQAAGALLAALLTAFLTEGESVDLSLSTVPALLAEFLFTFALVFVVLHVATAKWAEGNSYFGLCIGGTVTVGAYSVGAISGGAFNPAVALGLVVMGAVPLMKIWIYLVACFAGGILAALFFNKVTLARDSSPR